MKTFKDLKFEGDVAKMDFESGFSIEVRKWDITQVHVSSTGQHSQKNEPEWQMTIFHGGKRVGEPQDFDSEEELTKRMIKLQERP